MLIEYSSNNSGGKWWLSDKDWIALSNNGWKVVWCNEEYVYNNGDYTYDEKGLPITKKTSDEEVRWLGALARYAHKHFDSVKECLTEFEKITGQDVSAEGCNCCGAPHSFAWDEGYCSGKDCLQHMYDNVPSSIRECCT